MKDYEKDNNYEYVHDWLNQVNTYLAFEFEKEDIDKNKRNFEMLMSNKEEYIMIGAIYNEKIIAAANLSLNLDNNKMKHIGNFGIAIHPDFHNQGLGYRLLTIIEKIAYDKGILKLEAEYYGGNKNAEILYLNKMDYIVEGKRKLGTLLKDGYYTDKILIGKILDKPLKTMDKNQ